MENPTAPCVCPKGYIGTYCEGRQTNRPLGFGPVGKSELNNIIKGKSKNELLLFMEA